MQRIRMNDGRRRRLTVREAARLQSFPDSFEFSGSVTSQFTQIGNAVPPMLAYGIAMQVAGHLGRASAPVAQLAARGKLARQGALALG